MARARALLVLLAAARSLSTHAAAVVPSSPAIASKAVLGTAVAPVGVAGAGGRGRRPFPLLAYGALAALAGAGLILARVDMDEDPWPDVDKDDSVDEDFNAIMKRYRYEQKVNIWMPGYYGRRYPGAERRAMKKMLKLFDRRLKEFLDAQKVKHKKKGDEFWELMQDLVKKATILKSAINLFNDFRAFAASGISGSVLLIEKFGDPVMYFVCPYSGYNEAVAVFLYTVKPTQPGDGTGGTAAPTPPGFCTYRMNVTSLAELEAMGGSNLWQETKLPFQTYIKIDIKTEDLKNKWGNSSWGKEPIRMEASLIKLLEEADVKNKWENSSGGKRLILQKRSSWGENLISKKRRASLNDFVHHDEERRSYHARAREAATISV